MSCNECGCGPSSYEVDIASMKEGLLAEALPILQMAADRLTVVGFVWDDDSYDAVSKLKSLIVRIERVL